jgi:hypothetical protein
MDEGGAQRAPEDRLTTFPTQDRPLVREVPEVNHFIGEKEGTSMALFISIGGFFIQQPGTQVTWSTTFGSGLDRRLVIQAPNISDDILGVVQLVAVDQAVVASNSGLSYNVTIKNPSTRSVRYNLNIQDPL